MEATGVPRSTTTSVKTCCHSCRTRYKVIQVLIQAYRHLKSHVSENAKLGISRQRDGIKDIGRMG